MTNFDLMQTYANDMALAASRSMDFECYWILTSGEFVEYAQTLSAASLKNPYDLRTKGGKWLAVKRREERAKF